MKCSKLIIKSDDTVYKSKETTIMPTIYIIVICHSSNYYIVFGRHYCCVEQCKQNSLSIRMSYNVICCKH